LPTVGAPAVDVVVVGAGLAGLVAARDLGRAGLEAVVLEARDRVGGRLLNQEIGGGEVVEAGGQWIGPTQHRVSALARELGVRTFRTYSDGEHMTETADGIIRYSGTLPPVSKVALADFGQAQLRLERMARTIPLHAPWEARRAGSRDAQTFGGWLRRNVPTRLAREFFTTIAQAVWAAEPEELSLLHVLFYVRSAGGVDALVDTHGGAQDSRLVGGSQRLCLELARDLDVRLSEPVRAIGIREGHVEVEGVTARRAIVAVPPALAGRIDYDPPMPPLRDQLTQRVPMGAVVKCHAVYGEPFWRTEGLSGQATSVHGPAKLTFDNSPPGGSRGALLCFLEARAARDIAPAERREAVLAQLARMFGPRAGRPDAWYERDWAAEPWTRGCYGGALPTGVWTSFGRALRPPVGPIHWAGAEYAEHWMGYMDGAVRSGEAQAAAVVAGL
jgi:monoamine oxidase